MFLRYRLTESHWQCAFVEAGLKTVLLFMRLGGTVLIAQTRRFVPQLAFPSYLQSDVAPKGQPGWRLWPLIAGVGYLFYRVCSRCQK